MSTRFSILAAAVASLALAQGASASAITISFSSPSIDLTGGPVADTITISGLTAASQAVTSYNLLVDFNPAQLSVTGITQGSLPDDSLLGGAANSVSGGVITLNDFSPDGDSAFAGQGDSYLVGTITFTPLGGLTGTSSPSFDLAGSQITGFTDPSCSGSNPPEPQCPFPILLKVTTGGGGTVPEPSSFALFGFGLGAMGLGLAIIRRRRGEV